MKSQRDKQKDKEYKAWQVVDLLFKKRHCDDKLAEKKEEIERDFQKLTEARVGALKDALNPDLDKVDEVEEISKKLWCHVNELKESENKEAQQLGRRFEIRLKRRGVPKTRRTAIA